MERVNWKDKNTNIEVLAIVKRIKACCEQSQEERRIE